MKGAISSGDRAAEHHVDFRAKRPVCTAMSNSGGNHLKGFEQSRQVHQVGPCVEVVAGRRC